MSILKKKGKEKNEIKGMEQNIACSMAMMFNPHEKELVVKCFELTLDEYIKKAKKSHRIILKCFWKNVGCYKKGEDTGEWGATIQLNKKKKKKS